MLLTLYWLRADLHLEAEKFIDELFQAADPVTSTSRLNLVVGATSRNVSASFS